MPVPETNRYMISIRNPGILGHYIGEIQAHGGTIGRNSRVWPPTIDCDIDDELASKVKKWQAVSKIEKKVGDADMI